MRSFPFTLVCLLLALSFSPPLTCAQHYARVWSSVELWTSRLEQQPSLLFKSAHAHGRGADNRLSIDLSTRYQRLLGFGGAITESSTSVLSRLSPQLQEQVVQAYYDRETGHGYTLARVAINSCDFSSGNYCFDTVSDDFSLQHFDDRLTRDTETVIPFIQRALKASVPRASASSSSSSSSNPAAPALRLFASPWSPPAWMKGNNAMTGSSSPCLKPDRRYHQAWADYFVRWLSGYSSYGIHFFAVTVQNEPEFAAPWEACAYTASEQRDFIVDFLHPTLRRHDVSRDVRILQYDHNKDHAAAWAEVMFNDAKAAAAVWGTAVHWYSGDSFDALDAVHELSPEHSVLATEACNCPGVQLNSWARAEKYAHDIIGDLNHWAVGWTDWNIALDAQGGPNHLGNLCDAQIIVRTDWSQPGLHFQPTYYVFGHFSRFLRPGAVRVAHSLSSRHPKRAVTQIGETAKDAGAASVSAPQSANIASDNANIEVTSWLDEAQQQLVIVLFNPSDEDEQLTIEAKHDLSVVISLPAHSLHTLLADAALF